MAITPDIDAEITVLPVDVNPRKGPLRDDVLGYFGCSLVLPSGKWDCRMTFPYTLGSVNVGESTRALIQLLSPNEVLPQLHEGDSFQLWDGEVFASGIIIAKDLHQSYSAERRSSRELWTNIVAYSGPISLPVCILYAYFASKGIDGGWSGMAASFYCIGIIIFIHIASPIVLLSMVVNRNQKGISTVSVPSWAWWYYGFIIVATLMLL